MLAKTRQFYAETYFKIFREKLVANNATQKITRKTKKKHYVFIICTSLSVIRIKHVGQIRLAESTSFSSQMNCFFSKQITAKCLSQLAAMPTLCVLRLNTEFYLPKQNGFIVSQHKISKNIAWKHDFV